MTQVAFGRAVTGFREQRDGIAVRIAGGTGGQDTVHAGLLVSTNGVASAVRGQLLPHARPADLRWAIYGRTAIDRYASPRIPAGMLTGFSRVLQP